MLTLYHWEPNANSGKPIQALKEKGVDFESHWIDVFQHDHHQDWYLEINPLGVVPAMKHDDLNLYESTAIMEYVDEAFDGPPLRPADAEGRWRMRWWMKFVDQYYAPSVSMLAWSRRAATPPSEEEANELKEVMKKIPQKERQKSWEKSRLGTFKPGELDESDRRYRYGVKLMEEHLAKNEWLAGGMFSIADICAFNLCYFMPMNPNGYVSDEKTPHTMEWLRKIYERPATVESWNLGRMFTADRLTHLKRPQKTGENKA